MRGVNHRECPHATSNVFSSQSSAGLAVVAAPSETPAHAHLMLRPPAQDPHILAHGGLYYYCESSAHGIFVRSSSHFLSVGVAESRRVWAPPARGPVSRNIWAPELHRIDGRFYIHFAADNGVNANHRMWVLTATTDDPAGPYVLTGMLETGGWAIDGTVLTDVFGNHTFVWSGWPGRRNGRQNLYMARMKSPTELAGAPVLLTGPDSAWECRGMPICEGPQVLQRGGRTFIVYSASGSWTKDYCLGLLVHDGGDFLNPATWRKLGPVFEKNAHACGVGHCCFVTTPDGAEDWIVYHAKTSRLRGWADREVRAQRFSWSTDDSPVFGSPRAIVQDLAVSGSSLPVVEQSA
jgi:GH43 family beta-xylosidase